MGENLIQIEKVNQYLIEGVENSSGSGSVERKKTEGDDGRKLINTSRQTLNGSKGLHYKAGSFIERMNTERGPPEKRI